MRLKTLLSLVFGLIALVVAVSGALGAWIVTSQRLERRIGAEVAGTAGNVRNLMDRNMFNRWRDISVLASVAETTANTSDARRAWVESMKRTFPAYAWIGFANADGVVTAATGRMLEGSSVAERPWFQAGKQHQYAGDLHEATLLAQKLPQPTDGAPWRFVDVSAPVRDASGHLEGVVGAHLSWTWARDLIKTVLTPVVAADTSDILVVNEAGTVILGPPSLQDQPVPAGSTSWKIAHDGDAYAVETWPDGQTYLVGASRTVGMADYPGLGWTVLVRQNAAIALAPAAQLTRELLLGGILLSGLAALLGRLIAARISRPVLALANAAELLGRVPGLEAPPFEDGGTDEVRRLSSTLTTMFQAVAARDRSLAEANQRLEERVEARTQELQAARLGAERANRAKTRFLAGMSHELRTPLHGMLGYAALLTEGELDDSQRQRADAMMAAGKHLLEMINRVLDLSDIEVERVDLRLANIEIEPLARACIDVVRPAAYNKSLALSLEVAPNAPRRVMADPTRVRQILLNLLSNAVKFTLYGSITVRLLPGPTANLIRIEVVDTGAGISPERRHRLFQDFERLGAEAGTVEGAGLGLALSARMATMMGGTMAYADNPARGSIFSLQLPTASAPVASASVAEDEPEPASDPAAVDQTGPLRILVVDDAAMNRDIAQAFLASAGHTVTRAESGQAAIDYAQAETFDVVLMDVRMPGMDGLEATRRIRMLPAPYGAVPIIALTAQAFGEQVQECQKAGMDAHLSKPFDREGLLAAVNLAAADARARSGLAAASPGEPVLNKAMFERTSSHLAPEAIYNYLGTIAQRCETLLHRLQEPDTGDRTSSDFIDAAHALAGSAGLFGFARLSDVARRFSYALEVKGSDTPLLRDEFAMALTETLRELDRIVSVSAAKKYDVELAS